MLMHSTSVQVYHRRRITSFEESKLQACARTEKLSVSQQAAVDSEPSILRLRYASLIKLYRALLYITTLQSSGLCSISSFLISSTILLPSHSGSTLATWTAIQAMPIYSHASNRITLSQTFTPFSSLSYCGD